MPLLDKLLRAPADAAHWYGSELRGLSNATDKWLENAVVSPEMADENLLNMIRYGTTSIGVPMAGLVGYKYVDRPKKQDFNDVLKQEILSKLSHHHSHGDIVNKIVDNQKNFLDRVSTKNKLIRSVNRIKTSAQMIGQNPKEPEAPKDFITPELNRGNRKIKEGLEVNTKTMKQIKPIQPVATLNQVEEKISLGSLMKMAKKNKPKGPPINIVYGGQGQGQGKNKNRGGGGDKKYFSINEIQDMPENLRFTQVFKDGKPLNGVYELMDVPTGNPEMAAVDALGMERNRQQINRQDLVDHAKKSPANFEIVSRVVDLTDKERAEIHSAHYKTQNGKYKDPEKMPEGLRGRGSGKLPPESLVGEKDWPGLPVRVKKETQGPLGMSSSSVPAQEDVYTSQKMKPGEYPNAMSAPTRAPLPKEQGIFEGQLRDLGTFGKTLAQETVSGIKNPHPGIFGEAYQKAVNALPGRDVNKSRMWNTAKAVGGVAAAPFRAAGRSIASILGMAPAAAQSRPTYKPHTQSTMREYAYNPELDANVEVPRQQPRQAPAPQAAPTPQPESQKPPTPTTDAKSLRKTVPPEGLVDSTMRAPGRAGKMLSGKRPLTGASIARLARGMILPAGGLWLANKMFGSNDNERRASDANEDPNTVFIKGFTDKISYITKTAAVGVLAKRVAGRAAAGVAAKAAPSAAAPLIAKSAPAGEPLLGKATKRAKPAAKPPTMPAVPPAPTPTPPASTSGATPAVTPPGDRPPRSVKKSRGGMKALTGMVNKYAPTAMNLAFAADSLGRVKADAEQLGKAGSLSLSSLLKTAGQGRSVLFADALRAKPKATDLSKRLAATPKFKSDMADLSAPNASPEVQAARARKSLATKESSLNKIAMHDLLKMAFKPGVIQFKNKATPIKDRLKTLGHDVPTIPAEANVLPDATKPLPIQQPPAFGRMGVWQAKPPVKKP